MHLSHESKGKWWQSYNVRCAMLLSLFLQVLLFLLGPMRKRNKKGFVTLLIWGAYLLADWTAGYALGLISTGEGKRYILDEDLAAFWAPFLLVHLGGQDTVTAFSLEDNQLWHRRSLELLVHLGLVVYVFFQTIPNKFWISTVLMFCAGTIKYAERTRALFLACLTYFKIHLLLKKKETMFQSRVRLEEEGHLVNYKHLEYKKLPIKEIQVVKSGYKFYKIFRGLMVDLVLSISERNESREFFFERHFRDAFQVMEVELNFMYDAFYTKMNVVHRKIGYLFRFFCYLLIAISFYRFVTFHEHELQPMDVAVSYTLFAGAIGLDFIALVSSVFSDWTLAWVENPTGLNILYWIRKRFLFKQSRWSNTMSQYNLINVSVQVRTEIGVLSNFISKVTGSLKFVSINEFHFTKPYTIDDDLKEFIFMELVTKATEASNVETVKNIWSSKGNWVLSRLPISIQKPTMEHKSECPEANMLERVPTTVEGHESECPETIISESVSDQVEFDDSLLRWHIATELCYCEESDENLNAEARMYRLIAKHISDYMMYLLGLRGEMMSAVAGIGQIRFQKSLAEAVRLFERDDENFMKLCKAEMKRRTCSKLLSSVGMERKHYESLSSGCRLANALIDISREDISQEDISQQVAHGPSKRWEIMSKVWVELLAYAATHIRPDAHLHHLTKGGELLTFVWLLMEHLGFGKTVEDRFWENISVLGENV